ncbi:MAG TPA: glutamyl-tRNA reductase [Tepidisphaeraceae bacterium]|nr:glutamyl-tRNA reductase [Tepidisphaeraceae bacterium]
MQRLLLLGLNHSTAPLAVRERLALNAEQRAAALGAFRAKFEGCEAVLLSTCNRVELYAARAAHGQPRPEEMVEFLASFRSIPAGEFRQHLYQKSERGVVEHLFTVASSLDSMVVGETQILGQVREAYDAARALGATGALLNPLFQRASAVGKQVMTETSLGEGRMSVASVAVDHAGRIFDHFDDKTVLCIGAGKMTSLVIRGFAALKPKRLLCCNRDPVKAQKLAATFGGQAVVFERLDEHLIAADIVVSSTGSAVPIITRSRFETLLRQRRYRPVFLIDIALPRDVEPGVGELENVYLYNLDDLQQAVSSTQSQRTESLNAARAIVARHVEGFLAWHRAREMGPFIERLSARYHQLAREELERTIAKLGDVTEAEKAHLEELTRRIVNKLLHDPITALRQSDSPHAPATAYLHAMEKLFQLGDNILATPDALEQIGDDDDE